MKSVKIISSLFFFLLCLAFVRKVNSTSLDNQNFLRNIAAHGSMEHTSSSVKASTKYVTELVNPVVEKVVSELINFLHKNKDVIISSIKQQIESKTEKILNEKPLIKKPAVALVHLTDSAEAENGFIANAMSSIFGENWQKEVRELIANTLKELAVDQGGKMLPEVEDMIAKALFPPTVPKTLYNKLLKNILTNTFNQLESRFFCYSITDDVWNYPREEDFDITKDSKRIKCPAREKIDNTE